MFCFLNVLAGLMVTSAPVAPSATSVSPHPIAAAVHFHDGSLLHMTMQQTEIAIMTRYGKLVIPFSDIRRIDVGLHITPAVSKEIRQAIQQLGSPLYKERDDASRRLAKGGLLAYSFLKKSAPHPDPEVAKRISRLLKDLSGRYPADELCRREEDVIHTTAFLVIGRIVESTLRAHSEYFGESSLKLSDLRTVYLRAAQGATELVIDATKYGSAPDQWLDTGTMVDPQLRLIIKSDGQVDLWPQGPGQYMAGPKGYTTAGKGGVYMAGTLLGRIGETGKVFVVGEEYVGLPAQDGRLYLHIVPSPWNNASTGNYRVKISAEFATTSLR